MKNRNIVKQNYNLINAKYKLSTSEIKFIMTVIAQIKMEDKQFKEYEIKVSELEYKLQAKKNETHLKQFAKKLQSKPLELPTQYGWIVANWFADIEYIRGQAKFKVTVSGKLKPYLLELKNRFVKYNLKHILPMKSNYSIRIYQLLKEYESLTKRTFTVNELQVLLQVPDSYKKKYNDFKKKVLKVAEKELIDHADIFFEFQEIKTNRRVTEILFRIKPNPTHQTEKQPSLFDADIISSEEYAKYIGKNVVGKGGIIKQITALKDAAISVLFEDGTKTNFQNIEILKSYI